MIDFLNPIIPEVISLCMGSNLVLYIVFGIVIGHFIFAIIWIYFKMRKKK